MTTDPILASRNRPAGTDGYKVPLVFLVEGGLHYIRGNRAPYFSLTYTQHRKGFPDQCYSGGAGHDAILALFPQFADLAALHLSDIEGTPLHAEANGWYWLAGAMGARELHASTFYADPGENAARCLELFAKHCRITMDEAEGIRQRVTAADVPRDEWHAIMRTMYPRWRAEAAACIARHNLRVYGDPLPVTA